MKRKIITVIASIMLLGALNACNKQSNKTYLPPDADEDEVAEFVMTQSREINEYDLAVLRRYNVVTQKELFNAMTSEQQAQIWRDRVQEVIDANPNMGQEKYGALTSLKLLISAELYGDTTSREDVTTWMEANMTLFGYEWMKGFFTTIDDAFNDFAARPYAGDGPIRTPGGGGGGGGGGVSACNCSTKSDWCTGVYAPYAYCNTSGGCGGSRFGCGGLWLYSCNGQCHDAYMP